MGILIIDGNSVFEIDEECYQKKKVAKECDIDKYMKMYKMPSSQEDNNNKKIEVK